MFTYTSIMEDIERKQTLKEEVILGYWIAMKDINEGFQKVPDLRGKK